MQLCTNIEMDRRRGIPIRRNDGIAQWIDLFRLRLQLDLRNRRPLFLLLQLATHGFDLDG